MSSKLRDTNLDKLDEQIYDVCVVGAGINGAVSAASLATRGAKVAMIDKGDFAGETSSQSSNLAWGGIKYLESWEFGLVWDLCASRNRLMKYFPSTVKEIRFLTTLQRGFRWPAPMIFLGSLLYWVMGRFNTRLPRYVSRKGLARRDQRINIDDAGAGVEYSDCYLHDNDARFVFWFVREALDNGAIAANYVVATAARFEDGLWHVDAEDKISGRRIVIRARSLVNTCGPYADRFNEGSGVETQHRHVFSKGVHLLVNRVPSHGRILAFFASDGRLFFVMPMGPQTCIGTTDAAVDDPDVGASKEDRQFILDNANALLNFDQPLTQSDVIAERVGVRPLAVTEVSDTDDWIALSRKHAIDIDKERRQLTIFGGKITDCINVGDEVCEHMRELGVVLSDPDKIWYGEPDAKSRSEFHFQAAQIGLDEMADARASESLSDRLWRRYGESAFDMLDAIREDPQRAQRVLKNAEYLQCEIEYTARREMITKLDDFLRRRSKISLVVPREEWIDDPGLLELCKIIFGDEADAKLAEYRSATE